MFLTKECDYGLRIIRTLADGEKKAVGTICDVEHIPQQYAYKILKKLERSGFVKSHKGREGGYQLVKPVDSFTMYDIASSVGENLFLCECLREDKQCRINNPKNPCTVHLELRRIQEVLAEEMRAKPMSEVLHKQK